MAVQPVKDPTVGFELRAMLHLGPNYVIYLFYISYRLLFGV